MKIEIQCCWQADETKEQQLKKSVIQERHTGQLVQNRLNPHLVPSNT